MEVGKCIGRHGVANAYAPVLIAVVAPHQWTAISLCQRNHPFLILQQKFSFQSSAQQAPVCVLIWKLIRRISGVIGILFYSLCRTCDAQFFDVIRCLLSSIPDALCCCGHGIHSTLTNHFVDRELQSFNIAVRINARLSIQRVVECARIGKKQLVVAELFYCP